MHKFAKLGLDSGDQLGGWPGIRRGAPRTKVDLFDDQLYKSDFVIGGNGDVVEACSHVKLNMLGQWRWEF